MKRLAKAISPYLHAIVITGGCLLLGLRIVSYGTEFDLFILAAIFLAWILQDKKFSEQSEELESIKRHSFRMEIKHYKAEQRETIACDMLSDEQVISFLKTTRTKRCVDSSQTYYRYFSPERDWGMFDYGD